MKTPQINSLDEAITASSDTIIARRQLYFPGKGIQQLRVLKLKCVVGAIGALAKFDRESGMNRHCRQILFLQSAYSEDECEVNRTKKRIVQNIFQTPENSNAGGIAVFRKVFSNFLSPELRSLHITLVISFTLSFIKVNQHFLFLGNLVPSL